jgi:phosphopantothenoylcysteine synthetase/decarboxylase
VLYHSCTDILLKLVFRTTIRDKIIPHAVSWFTGEAVQGEDFANLGDDDEDDDDEDDDDDKEEDEDEEEESKPARKLGLQLISNMFRYGN